MLNEPVQEAGGQGGGGGGGGGSGGIAEAGSGHMNYIQVTPQEKEAIERVSLSKTNNSVLQTKQSPFQCSGFTRG